MEFEELSKYRPDGTTVAAYEAALTRISAARDAAALAIEAAQTMRKTALLSGGASVVRQAEEELAAARLDCEQLEAMAEQIKALIPDARTSERVAVWEQRDAELFAMLPEINAFGTEEFPGLARAIVAGLRRVEAFRAAATRRQAEWQDEPDHIKAQVPEQRFPVDYRVDHANPLYGDLLAGVRIPLVYRQGETLTREEIEARVWAGRERPIA
jgi:hypothetical protein